MSEQLFGPENNHSEQLRHALSDVADFALLTSNMQNATGKDVREIRDAYEADATLGTWLQVIEQSQSQTDLLYGTMGFMDDDLLPNSTLAMLRMDGQWDRALELEEQLPHVVALLADRGYNASIVPRISPLAKVIIRVVPGTTAELDHIALNRKRRLVVAENPSLPKDNPRKWITIDKNSWFALNIPILGQIENAAAHKEMWLIVICAAIIHDMRFDWEEMREYQEAGGLQLADLEYFLAGDSTPDERQAYAKAVQRAQQLQVPDELIMSRLFDTAHLMRLWSPLSIRSIEDYIAASTPGGTYAVGRGKLAFPGLLTPAANVYHIAGQFSHLSQEPDIDIMRLIRRR